MKFADLEKHAFIKHGFVPRVPGVEVDAEREEALERLRPFHEAAKADFDMGAFPLVCAEQVHGCSVAVVAFEEPALHKNVDALVSDVPGICLGIYVADCCAVYLVDPVRRCIGLVHSGAKGTRLGIVSATIETMVQRFGSKPSDLVAQLGPCIRPPLYETDFAAEIVRQCKLAGIAELFDCSLCTGSDLKRFYSYRMERGKTGRMLALLAIR